MQRATLPPECITIDFQRRRIYSQGSYIPFKPGTPQTAAIIGGLAIVRRLGWPAYRRLSRPTEVILERIDHAGVKK